MPTPRPAPTNAPEYAGASSSEGEQPKQQVGGRGKGRPRGKLQTCLGIACLSRCYDASEGTIHVCMSASSFVWDKRTSRTSGACQALC